MERRRIGGQTGRLRNGAEGKRKDRVGQIEGERERKEGRVEKGDEESYER